MKLPQFCLMCLVFLFAASGVTDSAEAQNTIKQPYGGKRPVTVDVHAGFTWHGYGLAAGARVGIPLVHNGLAKKINNAFYLSVGADLYFVGENGRGGRYGLGLGIPVMLHWEFYFNREWSAFVELGINIYFRPGVFSRDGNKFVRGFGPWFGAAIGAQYNISRRVGLVFRIGNPYLMVGAIFAL